MTVKNQETAAAKPEGDKDTGKPVKLTAAAWAVQLGIAPKADPRLPWVEPVAKSTKEVPLGIHLHAADVLHGWSQHAYNYQAEADAFLMLEEDFKKALEAAAGYPACNAHMPAVAPKAPFRAELEQRAAAEKGKADAAELEQRAAAEKGKADADGAAKKASESKDKP